MRTASEQKPHVDPQRVGDDQSDPGAQPSSSSSADDGVEGASGQATGVFELRQTEVVKFAKNGHASAEVVAQTDRRIFDDGPFWVAGFFRGFLLRCRALFHAYRGGLRVQVFDHAGERGLSGRQLSSVLRLDLGRLPSPQRVRGIARLELAGDQKPNVYVTDRNRDAGNQFNAGTPAAAPAQHSPDGSLGETGLFLELADSDAAKLGQRLDAPRDAGGERSGRSARRVPVVVANETEGVLFGLVSRHDDDGGHVTAARPAGRMCSGSLLHFSAGKLALQQESTR